MTNLIRKLSTFLIVLLFTNSTFAQSSGWEEYYSCDKAKISYKYVNCKYQEQFDQEHVILKIENLSNYTISIKWEEELWYDNKCINCEQNREEFRTNIKIKEGEISIGDCIQSNKLRIFSKFTEPLEEMPGVNTINKLTKFELKNITISYE